MFTGRGKQLTVFVTETDQYHHQALYMAIIEMLRREGCSGAIGHSRRCRVWRLNADSHRRYSSTVARSATRDHSCGQT